MKALSISVGLLTIASTLFAAPVGNPSFPRLLQEGYIIPCNSWVDLRLGYEGDFIGDACLKQYDEGHGRVDNYEQNTNSGTVTLNFNDRLDIYGVFGSSRATCDWRFRLPDLTYSQVEMETGYHFLWGVGGRCALFEWGNTILGLGGRYSAANMKPVWMTINGALTSAAETHLRYREWQIDSDLSYKVDIFIPYFGLKYSSNHTRMGTFPVAISNSGSGSLHMKNRKPVGIVIGCALTTGKYFMLNVEGRLIDEMAATIAGDFRF